MKNIKYLFVMIFAVALSVSCSSDDDSSSTDTSDLIGSWVTSNMQEGIEYDIKITFNVNNSGTTLLTSTFDGFTKTESEAFTWSTNGNKLTMNGEVGTYSISENKLTINADGETLEFTKQ